MTETITRLRTTHECFNKLWVTVLWELEGWNENSETFEWSGKDDYDNPWFGESKTLLGEINTMRL
jgi:hypothetical protein